MRTSTRIWFAVLGVVGFTPAHGQSGFCPVRDVQLEPTSPQAGELFGSALSLDGETLVVGSPGYDRPGGTGVVKNTGRATVYSRTPTGWVEQSVLEPPALPEFAWFGTDLDLEGDRLVVGASGDDGGAPGSGAVRVFERSGGSWGSETLLIDSQGAPGDSFGSRVAISGDTIVVGARFVDGSAANSGAVFVFVRSPGGWQLQARLADPTTEWFGNAVAIDGDVIAVGSRKQGILLGRGAVHVFRRAGTSWTLSELLQEQVAAHYGTALALEGNTLVVADEEATRVHVYEFDGQAWAPQGPFDGTDWTYGNSVAIDGGRFVVGAPYATTNPPAHNSAGIAWSYGRFAGLWRQVVKLQNCEDDSALVGDAVDVDGDTIVLGASFRIDSSNSVHAGAVLVYEGDRCFEVHCTGKPNSLGCAPRVTTLGTPGLSTSAPFDLIGNNIVPNEIGLLVYGTAGRANLDFHGGKLCVKLPATRLFPKQGSGSSAGGPCPGELRYDFNGHLQSGADAALTVGARVNAQWRYRDPAASFGDGLTDAVEFCVNP